MIKGTDKLAVMVLITAMGKSLKGVHQAFEMLEAREYEVLKLRSLRGKSLDETANALGVTRERVRQVEAKALRKIRRYLETGRLE